MASELKVLVDDLKGHVDAFVAHEGQEIEGVFHRALRKFAEWVEGKQAEADAKALLLSKGYTVQDPPTGQTNN